MKQSRIGTALVRALALGIAALLTACATSDVPDTDGEGLASRFTRVGSLRLHYQNQGEGSEALVFIHGWACDQSFWRYQTMALGEHVRVLAIDLPGHGLSDQPKIRYTAELFASAVLAVLDDAEVDKATLVGHSTGVPVALHFYRRFPHRVRGIVAVDGSLRSFFRDEKALAQAVAPFRGSDYKDNAKKLLSDMLPSTNPALANSIEQSILRTPQHVMVSAFEAANDPTIFSDEPIAVPMLAVLAKAPHWTDKSIADMQHLAPNLDLHVMDDVRHFLMMERPDEFNHRLAGFLHSVKAGPEADSVVASTAEPVRLPQTRPQAPPEFVALAEPSGNDREKRTEPIQPEPSPAPLALEATVEPADLGETTPASELRPELAQVRTSDDFKAVVEPMAPSEQTDSARSPTPARGEPKDFRAIVEPKAPNRRIRAALPEPLPRPETDEFLATVDPELPERARPKAPRRRGSPVHESTVAPRSSRGTHGN